MPRAGGRRPRRGGSGRCATGCGSSTAGPVAPPHGQGLEELILTVLSQSTNDRNRDVAYLRLRARFPAWEEVRDAPLEEVEAAIQPGGLHRQKSVRIQEILRELPDPPDLSFLAELPVDEARAYLTALPGVGRKTAACVLLFAFGMPDVPVDTHVSRVGTRLGPLPPRRAVRGAPRRDAAPDAGGRRGRAPHQPAAARPPHVSRAAAGLWRVRPAPHVPLRARAQARLERADHFASLLLHSSTDAPSPPRSMRVTSTPNTPEAREPRILPRTV